MWGPRPPAAGDRWCEIVLRVTEFRVWAVFLNSDPGSGGFLWMAFFAGESRYGRP